MPQGHQPSSSEARRLERAAHAAAAERARKIVWIVSVLEAVVAVLIGVFASKIFTNGNVAQVVSVVLPFIGVIFGVSYVALDWHMDGVIRKELSNIDLLGEEWKSRIESSLLTEISSVVSRETTEFRTLLPFINSYFECAAQDSFNHRETILERATDQFDALTRGELELEDEDYYDWLRHRLGDNRPAAVRAVSRRPLDVYVSDPREINFIQNNLAAIEAGTKITRVYIANEADFLDRRHRKVISAQFLQGRVECFLIWESRLRPGTLSRFAGGGLSIYDNDEVFYDRSYLAHTVGESSAMQSSPLQPRASVYSKVHPRFKEFVTLYESLLNNSVLPAHRKCPQSEVYLAVLEDLLEWLKVQSSPDPQTITEIEQEIADVKKLTVAN